MPPVPPSRASTVNYIVAPFINPSDKANLRFPRYTQDASKIFTVTDLAHCRAAIFPYWWGVGSKNHNAWRLIKQAREVNKPTMLFTLDDYPTSPPKHMPSMPGVLVFKPSLFASIRGKHEHAIPALRRDTMQEAKNYNLNINPRPKANVPRVGFCGQVASAAIRTNAISRFAQSSLDTKFLIRGSFWGGVPKKDIKKRSEQFHATRKAFIHNILDCDFTLCVRGAGNWSIRFYETLSLGRIPILIDTDCVLPFDNIINWSQYIIIIDRKKLADASQIVMARYEATSPKQFTKWQQSCRDLWLKYLSLEGFSQHLRTVVK